MYILVKWSKTLSMVKIFLFCFTLLSIICLKGCAATKSETFKELSYPEQTTELVLADVNHSDNPLLGSKLTYQSRYFDHDIFNVFIYPIRQTQISDVAQILNVEMRYVFKDIDKLIAAKQFQKRDLEQVSHIQLKNETQAFTGIRGVSKINVEDELYMHAYVYLFSQQDKVIRISTNMKFADQLPAPDEYVLGILAELVVPEESAYMKKFRAEYRNK
ncbi:hypothetical protein [Catenovulum maritimum]|uniref:Uncharacterized protein n=1 Tax=Catenovulum maritimum TaxID=1513271 RepID=A0A0J8GTT4_9ALTE|nr:hypothetical protein [Catenovulum maritimum]KMT66152.1 hypothetical protein XM47_05110 [Catenovulum maritimum]